MTQAGFPDTLKNIIDALNAALPLAYVGDELPPSTALERRLPIVLVQDVPGGADDIPWQAATGPLTDIFSADFYVLASNRRDSRELAARVRGIIWSLLWNDTVGARHIVERSGWSRVPDWNPNVKREHAEYDFHISRH